MQLKATANLGHLKISFHAAESLRWTIVVRLPLSCVAAGARSVLASRTERCCRPLPGHGDCPRVRQNINMDKLLAGARAGWDLGLGHAAGGRTLVEGRVPAARLSR